MAKRKNEVGRPTDFESSGDLVAASEQRNRELEERIRVLESEREGAVSVETGPVGSISADELSGEVLVQSDEEMTEGFWVNEHGNLCIGNKCMVMEATPDGLVFELDPDNCDPKTREILFTAMMKGTRMGLHEE